MNQDEFSSSVLEKTPEFIWRYCGAALAISMTISAIVFSTAAGLKIIDFPTEKYFSVQAEAYEMEKLSKYQKVTDEVLREKAKKIDDLIAELHIIEQRIARLEAVSHSPNREVIK